MKEGEKYLMVPREHSMVTGYASFLDELAEHSKKDFSVAVKPSTIEEGDVSFIVSILTAAQHKKKWIDMLLFNISFEFLREEYSENEFLSLEEWSSSPAYQRWFQTMNERLPFSIFFLKSEDARLFSIQGDFLQELLQKAEETRGDKIKVEVPAETVNLINNRLFMSCSTFYTYCSGMHVEAKEYIEALLAEQNASFGFKQVHKDWLANNYRMSPTNKGE